MLQPSPQSDVGQQQSPYLALSYGSLSEAYYQALIEDGTNPNLLISLKRGLEVPTLHANGESQWIFDVATKKVLVTKIYTVMTGSVVTLGKKKTDNKKKRGSDNKENVNGNKRARGAAGKAKAKAKSAAIAMPNIPDEKDLNSATIECAVGVRNKLWIDDLLKCASHVSTNVASSFGVADAQAVINLKTHLIEMGLMFAFKEQIMLETQKGPKQFKKWSTMRPALKEHAQIYMLKITLGAAMDADAQTGSSGATGVDQLEAAVANTCEKMMLDKDAKFADKLSHFLSDFESWVSSEPSLKLDNHTDILDVTKHATFGRMKATVLTSLCICDETACLIDNGGTNDGYQSGCPLHAAAIQLSDLVYEITSTVHHVFTDRFMCFAQLLREKSALQDIRCAYILQLMATLVGKTAKNLLPIFQSLRGNDSNMITKHLRDLDTCLLSQEALCTGWTKGLEQLLNSNSITPQSVLVELKIKPVTPTALQLLGAAHQISGESHDADADGDQPICLTIDELLLFGSDGNDVVGTDQLHLLQLTLQTAIIKAAIKLEDSWRSKLTIVITSEEEKTTKGRKNGGPTKSELLLRIDDPSSLMRSAKDPAVQLYRLPEKFELAFSGTVGHWRVSYCGSTCINTISCTVTAWPRKAYDFSAPAHLQRRGEGFDIRMCPVFNSNI
eukprot:s268_g26.t1